MSSARKWSRAKTASRTLPLTSNETRKATKFPVRISRKHIYSNLGLKIMQALGFLEGEFQIICILPPCNLSAGQCVKLFSKFEVLSYSFDAALFYTLLPTLDPGGFRSISSSFFFSVLDSALLASMPFLIPSGISVGIPPIVSSLLGSEFFRYFFWVFSSYLWF